MEEEIIARMWNLAGGPRTFDLSLPAYGIGAAVRTTHIETDVEPAGLAGGALRDDLGRRRMETYRLTLPPG